MIKGISLSYGYEDQPFDLSTILIYQSTHLFYYTYKQVYVLVMIIVYLECWQSPIRSQL